MSDPTGPLKASKYGFCSKNHRNMGPTRPPNTTKVSNKTLEFVTLAPETRENTIYSHIHNNNPRENAIFLHNGPCWTPDGVQMSIMIQKQPKHGLHKTPKHAKMQHVLFIISQTYTKLCISGQCRRHLAHPLTIRNQNL